MTIEPANLAEQALANLVNQFARPLDFLRELAQNAMDAGSARIAVSIAFDPPAQGAQEGVLRISVDDWGEGMDEEIIDNQLTRLFSSTKEGDLTKIGKFGIGFTSIFAIGPEAVLLRTGRHGEYWELLFHKDRSFDKVRIDEPVDGTKITLFKRMPPGEVERFIEEARFILDYWCEHSDTPIAFWDQTRQEPVAQPETDDPFAAFTTEAPVSRITINRPLDLPGADLQIHHREGDVEVVIGYCSPPRFGWYNGGLTLLHTSNVEALGRYAQDLGHVSFKVKHDRLEHTLTRDNVLHDDHWQQAMQVVQRAHKALRLALIEQAEQATTAGDHPALTRWHGWLAKECKTPLRENLLLRMGERPLFLDHAGRPLSLGAIRNQEQKVGSVLVSGESAALHEALDELDVLVVADAPETRELLLACEEPPLFIYFWDRRTVEAADQVFVMPEPVPPDDLSPEERRLIQATEELLRAAVGLRLRVPRTDAVLRFTPGRDSLANRLSVLVGQFEGPEAGSARPLALNGPRDGRVFQRPGRPWISLPAFLRWRTLLVNRNHPLFRAQLLASAKDLPLAALGLAQALLHVEGIEGERAHRRMLEAFLEQTEARP